MKIGKKLMVLIIGLNLAGAGILGGIILQISQKTIQGRNTKEIIRPEEKTAAETGRNTANPRLGMNVPQRINKTSTYRLLTMSATIGGLMIIFITSVVFITVRKDVKKEDPVISPNTADNKDSNSICTIKQIASNINDLNKELDRQAESILQSTLAIERMLANIQLVTKNLAHDNGTILLDGTQGKPP
ncbi:MAG: hypothetical protein LBG07_03765, partial [Treponema sp.]|nr:hypothetical protein [Treponema sp.]